MGNGFCNDEFNTVVCNFDGGDCCGSCVNTKYCDTCECFGKNSTVIINEFLGDGFCRDETNNADCIFDGLDCCGYDANNDGDYDDSFDINVGDTSFCTQCLCLGKKSFEGSCHAFVRQL